jgi:aminoglycoside phosphotransferase (APT) family kinase protein
VSDQPVSTAAPWRTDPGAIQTRLAAWARHLYGDDAVVSGVEAPDSGMTNDTVLFTLDGERLVARLIPRPDAAFPTFRTHDLEFQRRVMDLVRTRTTVPVPDVVHVETSPEWLEVPFLVMRAVDGVVPSDNPPYLLDPGGWFLQGTPEEWRRFEQSTVGVFVRLHHIRDDGDETAFLQLDAPGATPLARQVADLRVYYEWARGEHTIPILERGVEVVTETMPSNDRGVLNWGDGRPGNIIYRDFEPAAVLDWEMATVAPPEVDVAWTTFFQKFFAAMAEQYGLPPVPAMFDSVETAATYEELGGQHLDDLTWYEALAGCRFGIIVQRITQRGAAFGGQALPTNPDDMIMFAPLLDQLLRRLS